MRIAQIAPLFESVPPKLYGGAERVVSWLTEELIGLGHYVALFASGDSLTDGARLARWPARPLSRPQPDPSGSRPQADPAAAYSNLLEAVAGRAGNFDVIHCHVDWMHLPLLRRLGMPFLATLHNRLDPPSLATVRPIPGACLVSTSNSQRARLPGLNWVGTVYHGIPAGALTPRFGSGDYLALLGGTEKDQEIAIRLARTAGMPLRIAAKVDDAGKQAFLGKAAALLFPGDWPGLVTMEAMACGTPIIAWRRGSDSETIDDGVTGFVVDSDREAVEAIRRVRGLDRRAVRDAFDQRFTATRMAQDYLCAYQKFGAKEQASGSVRRSNLPPSSAIGAPAGAEQR
jgi:glycosyltransferase involved in cell wall biosynthesis